MMRYVDMGTALAELDSSMTPLFSDLLSGERVIGLNQTNISVGVAWRPIPEISLKAELHLSKGIILIPDPEHFDERNKSLIFSVSYTYQ